MKTETYPICADCDKVCWIDGKAWMLTDQGISEEIIWNKRCLLHMMQFEAKEKK